MASLDISQRGALWIIAAGVVAAALYFLREPLTQFAMALFLWLAIDGLAETLDKRVPFMPRWLALPIALVLVLGLAALIGVVVVENIAAIFTDLPRYEFRLNQVLAQAHQAVGSPGGPSPTVRDLIAQFDSARLATEIGESIRNAASASVFTLIFLAFLFPAADAMSDKLDRIFVGKGRREAAREVAARIRLSMERYLWVQTVMSLIITALTYATLVIIGLENALFWSFLIFFLNYIPTIGSLMAVILTTAVALVQFPTLGPVLAVFLGVSAWQFIIGNFVQPRMTGESLNLSAVVVLLALAIWGLVWGIVGAFLAAPLTVMIMIVLAQFRSTRWIAILLSADGKPTRDAPAEAGA
ncbi:MAG: AI-2E family transporter [Hyphomonadaceae bacterium]|nr:AI-2E family transporter [Hyphomonadaceae bacterium]GIK49190.1 MAG: AI-2E family transporter [Alphaproteobacteria bacterium]